MAADTGWVNVGTDRDTATFAVEWIRRWWTAAGRDDYPHARRLLITAEAGGSNGCRTRALRPSWLVWRRRPGGSGHRWFPSSSEWMCCPAGSGGVPRAASPGGRRGLDATIWLPYSYGNQMVAMRGSVSWAFPIASSAVSTSPTRRRRYGTRSRRLTDWARGSARRRPSTCASAASTRLTVVESGFAQLPDDLHSGAYGGNVEGWRSELDELVEYLDARA